MFKVGDKVRVLGKSEEYGMFSDYSFDDALLKYVGLTGHIYRITNTAGNSEPPILCEIDFRAGENGTYQESFYEKELELVLEDWDD